MHPVVIILRKLAYAYAADARIGENGDPERNAENVPYVKIDVRPDGESDREYRNDSGTTTIAAMAIHISYGTTSIDACKH